jgi:hypothetical protein
MPRAKGLELAEIVHRLLGDTDPELLERLVRRGAELGVDQLGSVSRTDVSASSAYS